jgi:hypothetical protein
MPKVTKEHKQALAQGRQQSTAIRTYLEALEAENAGRRRGRQRTPESIQQRIEKIDVEASETTNPMTRVQLIQERIDLEAELAGMQSTVSSADYEDGFVEAVKPYSERKGIGYSAWREAGVPAAVLKRAGISRARV